LDDYYRSRERSSELLKRQRCPPFPSKYPLSSAILLMSSPGAILQSQISADSKPDIESDVRDVRDYLTSNRERDAYFVLCVSTSPSGSRLGKRASKPVARSNNKGMEVARGRSQTNESDLPADLSGTLPSIKMRVFCLLMRKCCR
jgi:hypothetical protein